jgi:hypothetical protein
MLTEYGNKLGDYGISIEENRDREKAFVSITSPVVREQFLYKMCDARYPSWDKGADFHKGDSIIIRFCLYGFQSSELQDVFEHFANVRKNFDLGKLRDVLPYSHCRPIQEKKFNTQNFVPEYGYYAVGMRENFLQDWQIGWTGGMISTYPLLFFGNEQTRKNVVRNFDWLFPDGISPSGFFWDAGKDGSIWYGGDIRKPHTGNWHLIRKSGDALYYIIKQFMLMEKLGIPVKAEWKTGMQRVCDAFVSLWNKNGQFGQFVDSRNGQIIVGGSTSGANAVGGLVLAAKWFGYPEYLKVAEEAGEYYYRNYTSKGITCGGPGDALQNPDSESSYALVESYSLLYDATNHDKWLKYAKEGAKQFASWVVTGDYGFPIESPFYKAGIHSLGAVYANTQNKHGAPGICTASGVALLRLYRATGDDFYRDLLQDISHNITQYLPCKANPIKNSPKLDRKMPFELPGEMESGEYRPEGWVCERVNMTDWEGAGLIGGIIGFSTWAETSLMLTTIEIPGIYIRSDLGTITAFDNMHARINKITEKEIIVEITNPTAVNAEITWFAEGKKEADKPLEENYLLNANRILLKGRETKKLVIKK